MFKKFNLTKNTNPGMVPDRGFTKQLKKLNPDYEVVWDDAIHRWEIWRVTKDGRPPVHVTTFQTKGRKYREVGQDVLLRLQMFDNFTTKQLIDYFEEMDRQIARKKAKAFRDKIDAIARETFINIHCKIIDVPAKIAARRAINDATV